MEPLTGKIFEELLKKGYTNDLSNLAVVSAHGVTSQEATQMALDYFGSSPLPAPKAFAMSQINPMALNGDDECIEFTIPASSSNNDITLKIAKWNDPESGSRVSVNALRGLVKWMGIDSIEVSKAKDDGKDTIVYAAKKGTTLVMFMDRTRFLP
jgi:hypothetical protein